MRLRIILDDKTLFDDDIDIKKLPDHPEKKYHPNKKTTSNIQLGKLGEFLVTAKLVQRGIPVAYAYSKQADLLLTESRTIIEVKAARKGYMRWKYKGREYTHECYPFSVKNKMCHFVVIWAVNINHFYIVPIETLKIGVNKIYPTAERWKLYMDNWDVLIS